MSFILEPEVGILARCANTAVHPPIVEQFEYEFDSWMAKLEKPRLDLLEISKTKS